MPTKRRENGPSHIEASNALQALWQDDNPSRREFLFERRGNRHTERL